MPTPVLLTAKLALPPAKAMERLAGVTDKTGPGAGVGVGVGVGVAAVRNPQLVRVPWSEEAASCTERVQVPFGLMAAGALEG